MTNNYPYDIYILQRKKTTQPDQEEQADIIVCSPSLLLEMQQVPYHLQV